MASSGRKGGPVKNPKREVEEDEDVLEDLVVEPKKDPKKGTSYSSLKPGGFIMKATDRGGRLSSKHGLRLPKNKRMMMMTTTKRKRKKSNWKGRPGNCRASCARQKRQ